MGFNPRIAAGVGLLALVPIAVYQLSIGESIVALSLLNTVIIVASLYYMLSPVTGAPEQGHAAT